MKSTESGFDFWQEHFFLQNFKFCLLQTVLEFLRRGPGKAIVFHAVLRVRILENVHGNFNKAVEYVYIEQVIL